MALRCFAWSFPVVLLGLLVALAADEPREPRRVAFLVGVSKYEHFTPDLKYAEQDVEELAKVLGDGGFEVVLLKGSGTGKDKATKKNIEARLESLLDGDGDDSKRIRRGDLVLVALSGHGQQIPVGDAKKEDAFFVPVDGMVGKEKTQVSISHLVDHLLAPHGGRNLLLVDACRDIADGNKGVEGRDIALKGETAVLFSCSRGEKSWESDKMLPQEKQGAGRGHGVFTHAVLKGLMGEAVKNGELTWSGLVSFVQDEMASREFKKLLPSGYEQTPIPTSGQLPRTVLMSRDPGDVSRDLASGEKVQEFEYEIDGAKKKGTCRVLTVDIGGGEKMEFVRIQKGKFTMGSPKDEKERGDDEVEHEVEISNVYVGKYTVTQAQYKAITGDNPSNFKGDRSPVEQVSWDDAKSYCEKLSVKLKRKVVLPSEAQWEYSCRAGTRTPFHFGSKLNGDLANCDGNYPYGMAKGIYKEKTTEVGSYPANPWGLYDMSGNVYQWCEDWYGSYQKLDGMRDPVQLIKQSYNSKVVRGGSWIDLARYCRSAYRFWFEPDTRSSIIGFRVCLPLEK